jgi:RNA polymerase sigma factor (sigma-70 family)
VSAGTGTPGSGPWIEAARRGDRQAQDEIVRIFVGFSRHILRWGGSGLASEMDPEDLAQEASRRFFSSAIEGYRGQGSERSYLYSIVKATYLQIWRSYDRRKRRELSVAPEDEALPAESSARLDVMLILKRLGSPCRELLERVYLDGATHAQLAAELQLEESSVRAKLSRCLGRARELAA